MTPVTTTTTNTKTVFQTKAPLGVMKTRTFTVLATLLLIEGVMIGQVLSRPGAAQTGAAEDCNKISDPEARAACWLKKIKAGEKILTGADLRGMNPGNVSLTRASLNKVDLRMSYLNGRDLTGANLTYANLDGATLSFLPEAKLSKANLPGANLTGANLKGAILRDIIKDKDTKGLPPGS